MDVRICQRQKPGNMTLAVSQFGTFLSPTHEACNLAGAMPPKKLHTVVSTAVGDTYPQHKTGTGVDKIRNLSLPPLHSLRHEAQDTPSLLGQV